MDVKTAPEGVLQLHADDNVVVTLRYMPKGASVLDGGKPLHAMVPPGHKIATAEIGAGAPIVKFGQIIGYAGAAIARGEHVHTHNCGMGDHDQAYRIGADFRPFDLVADADQRYFQGYRRAGGGTGTRNYIALFATVNCSATVVRHIADHVNRSGMLDDYPNVDGVIALAHGTGCGMASSGEGFDTLQRVLWGHATHVNVGAAVFVGLGCEVMQIGRMKEMFGASGDERFYGMTIQETGGTRKTIETGVEAVRELLPSVNAVTREPVPVSELTVGLQCGGSDGFSGITANPALGAATDMLVRHGGTALLSETPEIYGAEQLLVRRAVSKEVGEKLIDRIRWWENYTAINGGTMDNNPSPGNKAGGLTTILEKSLGAAAKGGTLPLADVILYAEKVKSHGFVFMDSPGYDPVSATGQIASGSQLVVFTTGRGSAFGSKPSPTIKLATNSAMYKKLSEDMDINCGDIIDDGIPVAEKGREIFEKMIAVASGEKSKSEALGLGDNEFVPWQIGAVM
ncbi:UxaA family hydrolase [Oricola cellulosilytica]|uniref:Altronate dehydratase n=1 Tax=Oricola cellulosilytica TaxID=1429082 RepID=A0A4R0P698_9HYPH|nr:altronate dehydratase family protein [Oricola cellulosilytica]TCD12425.1 altronate dehydratase [Oricola cellulosilytica]